MMTARHVCVSHFSQISLNDLLNHDLEQGKVYRVEYNYGHEPEYAAMARKLGIMEDWKVCGGEERKTTPSSGIFGGIQLSSLLSFVFSLPRPAFALGWRAKNGLQGSGVDSLQRLPGTPGTSATLARLCRIGY